MEQILSILSNNLSITKEDITNHIRDSINDICLERLNKFKEEVSHHATSVRIQLLEQENKELKSALKSIEENTNDIQKSPSTCNENGQGSISNVDDEEEVGSECEDISDGLLDYDEVLDDKVSNVKRITLEIVDPLCQKRASSTPLDDSEIDCEFCSCVLDADYSITLVKDDCSIHYCKSCYYTNKEDLSRNGWTTNTDIKVEPDEEETFKCQLCDKQDIVSKLKYELNREINEIYDTFVLCESCFHLHISTLTMEGWNTHDFLNDDSNSSEEKKNECDSCNVVLDIKRDGSIDKNIRCNNCYWEDTEGKESKHIIDPDYRKKEEVKEEDKEEEKEKEEEEEEEEEEEDDRFVECDECNIKVDCHKSSIHIVYKGEASKPSEEMTLCTMCFQEMEDQLIEDDYLCDDWDIEEEDEEEEEVHGEEDEEEEEEEVIEIEINGEIFYCTNEEDGPIYKDDNGEVGDEVGKLKDGEAYFD